MQKSDDNQKATITHRKVQASTTLNRRYVSRPKHATATSDIQTARKSIDMSKVTARMKQRTMPPAEPPRPTAKELKDQAIAKALANASRAQNNEKIKKDAKMRFGFGRVMLALSCTAAVVFAIVYFVNQNMPDISLKVAAMQSGIEAKYPARIPRGFIKSDIISEEGKITLDFVNPESGDSFNITEEKSSWDSNALLANYVRDNFDGDFVTIKDQGLTIFVDEDSAAWVNGGMVYKLNITSGALTKKQICSIAISL